MTTDKEFIPFAFPHTFIRSLNVVERKSTKKDGSESTHISYTITVPKELVGTAINEFEPIQFQITGAYREVETTDGSR